MEIILVDDGSTDSSYDIMCRYPGILTIKQENMGPAAARNTGLRRASGEIVHFLDSDVITPRNLVATHMAFHRKRPGYILQGQVIRILDINDAFHVPMSAVHYSRPFFATGNVSVQKKHVDNAGGFDDINFRKGWEDLDLGLRLRKTGLKVKRFYKKGFVWHLESDIHNYQNIQEYFDSRYMEGREAVRFYRKHPVFSVKLMTMAGRFFFILDRLLFNDKYLRSRKFYQRLLSRWENKKKNRAVFFLRYTANHFYLKGVRDKIREDGKLL